MCKTEKKIFKINIFGSTKDMKKNNFFYGLLVGGKKKMKNKCEKKKVAGAGMGYCPIPRLSHDTADCIVT